jgi:hypothetical protein
MERKPYLVCWAWAQDDVGVFLERVTLTDEEKTDLEGRLQRLEDGDDIADWYVGPEQEVPTPYNEFLKENSFLIEVAGDDTLPE